MLSYGLQSNAIIFYFIAQLVRLWPSGAPTGVLPDILHHSAPQLSY